MARTITTALTKIGVSEANTLSVIHTAINNITNPKPILTRSIHAPALGTNLLAEVPTNNNGTPIPKPITNRANPPTNASPVWAINNSAPAKGAATHGPTTSAESTPIAATPVAWPPV